MRPDWDYFWSVLMACGVMAATPHWDSQHQVMGYMLAGAILLRANTEVIVRAIRGERP